jgi:hypothetical protein
LGLDGIDPAYEQWLRANDNQERSQSNWHEVWFPAQLNLDAIGGKADIRRSRWLH